MANVAERPLPAAHQPTQWDWLTAGFASALAVLGLALFALPGATVQGYGFSDLFTFFDWINALERGRLPHVDFQTPVGALSYFIPYLGRLVAGQYAGALETAGAFVAAPMLALAWAALRGRATRGVALPFLLAVFGMVCVPWNPGDGAGMATHIGFYNRWGWAALAVLLLLGVSVPRRAGWRTDAGVVAAVLLFLFFLKMSYFVAASAFVVGLGLLLQRFVRAAAAGLAVFAAVVAFVQAATGMVLPYLGDGWATVQATGVVWPVMFRLNLTSMWPFCALAALACALTMRKGAAIQDAAMPAFGLAACVLVAAQNAEMASAFALLPAFVQASALGQGRHERWLALPWRPHPSALLGLMALFLLPQLAGQAVASAFHVSITRLGGDAWGRYQTVEAPRVGVIHTWSDDSLEYVRTLRSGVALLRLAQPPCGTVVALDFAQPFAALQGLPPSRSFLWAVHVGRAVNPGDAPSAASLFADVQCAMQPKRPLEPKSKAFLLEVYGGYLDEAFYLEAENADWRLHRRGPPNDALPAHP